MLAGGLSATLDYGSFTSGFLSNALHRHWRRQKSPSLMEKTFTEEALSDAVGQLAFVKLGLLDHRTCSMYSECGGGAPLHTRQ